VERAAVLPARERAVLLGWPLQERAALLVRPVQERAALLARGQGPVVAAALRLPEQLAIAQGSVVSPVSREPPVRAWAE